MKQTFVIKEDRPRLVLFFAGWGMDANPFRHFSPQSADLLVCYDYRCLEFKDIPFANYREITLVAWSFGVWAASCVLENIDNLSIVKKIAINGTPFPIDEERGITPDVFDATLTKLSDESLAKFHRRMCRNSADYEAFRRVGPMRPVDELWDELVALRNAYQSRGTPDFLWDYAAIARGDRIFLPQNQRNAWNGTLTQVENHEGGHFQNEIFAACLR